MRKIRILLVEDHAVVRQGLRVLLAAEADIEVVGEAENGRQAIALAGRLTPDVAVMDIAMPVLNGLEATRRLVRTVPPTRVVVLSSYDSGREAWRLKKAGALGYVVKQAAGEELLRAIREAFEGRSYFSPSIARRLCEQEGGNAMGLTPREAEVLQLIAEGLPNKQIASELGISIKTVEKHRQRVMDKLHIHDVAGLTRHAIAEGIVEPGSMQSRP